MIFLIIHLASPVYKTGSKMCPHGCFTSTLQHSGGGVTSMPLDLYGVHLYMIPTFQPVQQKYGSQGNGVHLTIRQRHHIYYE